ncbi:hypothetical protein B566_EDAN002419, partial [Ephemera danica]
MNLKEYSNCTESCIKKDTVCPKATCTTSTPAAVIEVTTDVSKQARPYSYSILRSTISERAQMCGEYECQEKDKITGNEHAKTCCALNLIHAEISHEDIQCLQYELMEMQEKLKDTRNLQNSIEQLFLISARDVMLDDSFLTCPKAHPLSSPRFLPGEPDNRFGIETCLAINLREDIQGLDDVSCNVAMRFLCRKPVAAKIIIPYHARGKQITGNEHAKTCCALNLIHDEITHEDIQCLQYELMEVQVKVNATRNLQNSIEQLFLISARDVMLDHKFLTCPKAHPLSSPRFLPGEPNNRFGIETCLAINLREDIQGLDDVSCNVAMRFLCRKPYGPKIITPYNTGAKKVSTKTLIAQCTNQCSTK